MACRLEVSKFLMNNFAPTNVITQVMPMVFHISSPVSDHGKQLVITRPSLKLKSLYQTYMNMAHTNDIPTR